MKLRNHCQNISIHTHLNGAHMIFPQQQGLAIRIYDCRTNTHQQPHQDRNLDLTPPNNDRCSREGSVNDPDVVLDFCNTFQWTLVLFVVSDMNILFEDNSPIQQSIRLFDDPLPSNHNNCYSSNNIRHTLHMTVVSNIEQAITAIIRCADRVRPARYLFRGKYIHRIRAIHYNPTVDVYQKKRRCRRGGERERERGLQQRQYVNIFNQIYHPSHSTWYDYQQPQYQMPYFNLHHGYSWDYGYGIYDYDYRDKFSAALSQHVHRQYRYTL
jgi:hypothetical protein